MSLRALLILCLDWMRPELLSFKSWLCESAGTCTLFLFLFLFLLFLGINDKSIQVLQPKIYLFNLEIKAHFTFKIRFIANFLNG